MSGILVLVAACSYTVAARGERIADLAVKQHSAARPHPPGNVIRVMTLNLAHGRGNRTVQRVLRKKSARRNLDSVVELVRDTDPHIIGFQEADLKAAWSGRFDHVGYITQKAGMANWVHACNVDGLGLAYGTAVASRLPIDRGIGYTFDATPPTFSKGWSRAVIPLDSGTGRDLEVVSVHLDFLSPKHRTNQARQLVKELGETDNHLLLMGDFNCGLRKDEETLGVLMDELRLTTYKPDAEDVITYPTLKERLDWILIGADMRFLDCEVVEPQVSDHLALIATIQIDTREPSERESNPERDR